MALKPVALFRVYPDYHGSSLHFHVYIWSTRKELQQAHKLLIGHKCNNSTNGFCAVVNWYHKKTNVKRRLIGEIHLLKKKLTYRVISHEVMHATLGWAQRIKLNMYHSTGPYLKRGEERACFAQGDMCATIAYRLSKLNLI